MNKEKVWMEVVEWLVGTGFHRTLHPSTGYLYQAVVQKYNQGRHSWVTLGQLPRRWVEGGLVQLLCGGIM